MQRLYVLCRRDLSHGQQVAQVGHAITAWCANEAARIRWTGSNWEPVDWRWCNEVLVVLGVRNEKELHEWHERFKQSARHGNVSEEGAVAWHEPDWQNQMTAFAVLGKREEFEGLDLL